MKVEISRFNATTFELGHPNKKERAFLRRSDSEFLEAQQAADAFDDRREKFKKMPFGLGRLIPPPAIEISEARWHQLRARISGSFPAVKLGP